MNGKQFAPLRPAILAAAQAVEPTAHSPRLGGTKSDGRPCVSIQHDNRDQKTAKRVLTAAVRSVIGPAIVYVVGPMTCSGLQPVRPAGGCYILDSMTREGDDVTMTFRRDPGPA